jgi:hypothetical protein
MDEQALAKQIAAEVLRNSQFWIAIVGVIGGVVGGILTLLGNLLMHWLKVRKSSQLDAARTKILRQMLNLRDWRKLSTISRVIGTDVDTTKRLLIEINARGSEKPRADNDEVWGLISKHPLDKIDADAP